MEQRPLRLGDLVDDYCPRERRITNHAIVAIVGDEIRQTRCATCDMEHVYKQARVPKRMTPKAAGGPNDAASDVPGQLVPRAAARTGDAPPDAENSNSAEAAAAAGQPEPSGESNGRPADGNGEVKDEQRGVDGWLAHRPLIRATLPRTNADPPIPRPIPEFTMHQRHSSGRLFRHGQGRHGGNGQSHNGFGGNYGNGRPDHGNQGGPGGGNGRPRRRRGGRHKPPR